MGSCINCFKVPCDSSSFNLNFFFPSLSQKSLDLHHCLCDLSFSLSCFLSIISFQCNRKMARLQLVPSRYISILSDSQLLEHLLLAGTENIAMNKKIIVLVLQLVKIEQQKCCEENKWYDTIMNTWKEVGDNG